jgi:protein phosphatase
MIFSGKTDVGKRRANNQDKFDTTVLPDGSVLLTVCDGMGGANGGSEASRIAISVFTETVLSSCATEELSRGELLLRGATAANRAVFEAASADEALNGMGTTLVSALVSPYGHVDVINVGDSRLYHVTSDAIHQITRDHSYVQYLVDMGQITVKEAKTASIRNIIIRSIGNEEETNPDLFSLELAEGEFILLCSDGLTNCVPVEVLEKTVQASSQEELDACADALITLANDGGGTDNITVVLAKR